jgi:tRNA(adenine34) deaminase
MMPDIDEDLMRRALGLAQSASGLDEVPVGAVIVKDGIVIGEGYNLRETKRSVLSHAELEAIHQANQKLNSWRLTGCTLYVTLEPCLMCAGAIYQSRIDRVVFGAPDPKAGATGSLYDIQSDARLNHRFTVTGGILADECGQVLKDFFRKKRV